MGKQDKSDGYEDLNTTFIDPNPHAFHMFENFELNRKIFVQEQEVVKLMRAVRKDLNNNVLKIEQSIKKFKYIDNDNIVKRALLYHSSFHIKNLIVHSKSNGTFILCRSDKLICKFNIIYYSQNHADHSIQDK